MDPRRRTAGKGIACFEPGAIYPNGSFAGPQIVLNGGAVRCVTVKAAPLRGRLEADPLDRRQHEH